MENTNNTMTLEQVSAENNSFIHKVYAWMTTGLAITAVTSYFVASTPTISQAILSNKFIFYGMLILEVLAVIYLAMMVKKISAFTAQIVFIAYSLLNGLTLSVIFFVFEFSSISTIFLVTAGMFGIVSLYGYFTKRDLTTIGSLSFMGLIGIILASIANMFIMNDKAFLVIAYIGVAVFVGLTAYDTQKIKAMNIIGNSGSDEDKKESIMGALTLYLDFINLFLKLLRIFGKRR